jgi:hypothetical protein
MEEFIQNEKEFINYKLDINSNFDKSLKFGDEHFENNLSTAENSVIYIKNLNFQKEFRDEASYNDENTKIVYFENIFQFNSKCPNYTKDEALFNLSNSSLSSCDEKLKNNNENSFKEYDLLKESISFEIPQIKKSDNEMLKNSHFNQITSLLENSSKNTYKNLLNDGNLEESKSKTNHDLCQGSSRKGKSNQIFKKINIEIRNYFLKNFEEKVVRPFKIDQINKKIKVRFLKWITKNVNIFLEPANLEKLKIRQDEIKNLNIKFNKNFFNKSPWEILIGLEDSPYIKHKELIIDKITNHKISTFGLSFLFTPLRQLYQQYKTVQSKKDIKNLLKQYKFINKDPKEQTKEKQLYFQMLKISADKLVDYYTTLKNNCRKKEFDHSSEEYKIIEKPKKIFRITKNLRRKFKKKIIS